MDRTEIIARLKQHEPDLRARGVSRAALFGSRARGDNRAESDTDILLEIDPNFGMDVYTYVGLQRFITSLLDGPVDVVQRAGLKPYMVPHVTADVVYAF